MTTSSTTGSFEKGLIEVADGVHAYMQPDGGWGYSNAGLIDGDAASVLVDTLFDLTLTNEMLTTMAPVLKNAPIATVVNTHANGDHCYGNQLVAGPGIDIVASKAAAQEMGQVPASLMAGFVSADLPDALGQFMHAAFGPFEFEGIDMVGPTTTFTGTHGIQVGQRVVELIELGPAHTGGDVVAYLPDEGVVFTGDIVFHERTPIMWAGPVSNWIAACDHLISLNPSVVVPGHGPLTDVSGLRDAADYLRFVQAGVQARHQTGMAATDVSRDLDLEINGTRFGSWGERERLIVTVHHMWPELEPDYKVPDVITLFSLMAEDFVRHTNNGDTK